MPYQNIEVFERDEGDGWKLILPVEGNRKFDANILNPEAVAIFNDLRQGKMPVQITEALCQKHRDVPYERIKNDVYAAIVTLRELGVYEMTESEIKEIYSNPASKLPGVHVMDETEIRSVSEKLKAAYSEKTASVLYSMNKFKIDDLSPVNIRLWHFHAMYTLFIHNNQDGNMDGIISLVGLGALNPVLSIAMLVVFHDDMDQRFNIAVEMLEQLEKFVKSFTWASKLRFIICRQPGNRINSDDNTKGSCQCETSVECSELYMLLEKCGFRHEATLDHEGGRGVHVEYYSKCLIE